MPRPQQRGRSHARAPQVRAHGRRRVPASSAPISWWRGHELPPRVLWTLGVLLVVPGLLAPAVLAPVERGWMAFAEVLGHVNTRIILTVLFYFVMTPVGFVHAPLPRSARPLACDDGRPSALGASASPRPSIPRATASSSERRSDDHDPRHLRLLPRLRGVPGARRRDRRRGAGGALHPQEARRGVSRTTPSRTASREAGIARRRPRLRRLLRQAAAQVRAPPRDLPRRRAARAAARS